MKLLISFVIVLAVLVGSLLIVLRGRRDPMGSPEALERARLRNLELEAREREEELRMGRSPTGAAAETRDRTD